MTYAQPLSPAAQWYTGQLEQVLAEKLVQQLRRTCEAQADANKASIYCQSNDYERAHNDLLTEKIELGRLLVQLGIERALVREVFL